MRSFFCNIVAINRIIFIIVLSVGIAFSSQTRAAIVVIDFDTGLGSSPDDYSEDGFSMQLLSGHYDSWGSGGTDDTPYLGLDANLAPSEVRFTGGLFNLISFEAISLTGNAILNGWYLWVTSSAGGNITTDINGINSFAGPEWSSLTWINIYSNEPIGGPGVDTITFNTVPIPATAWLFTSGLLGLLGIARKRKAI